MINKKKSMTSTDGETEQSHNSNITKGEGNGKCGYNFF